MGSQLLVTLLTCAACMAFVGWVSWRSSRNETNTAAGYFLAGRGLGGILIAGSLLLTNLSAEQLIGLNGSAYGHNLSSMAWEVTAAAATVAMAFVFLPRYLAGAFTTLPEFLKSRYDLQVQRLSVLLFLLGYGLVTIPSVLYAGSVAIIRIFDVESLLGITFFEALVVTILTVGITGALYATLGGLKAVAVSDTLNGVGLLMIGAIVPILGAGLLGEGNIVSGIRKIIADHPEKLNAIGSRSDPTPFGTVFTGMIIANLFYWCTNQYVIQRTLAARSLAEGQKGVLLSGFFKILVPLFMMIPGVIAFHLYGPGLTSIDLAYPQLVRDAVPFWMMGFFLAVLLGAVFSSFNSLLNSAATLFCIDIYAPFRGGTISDQEMVRVARAASIVIALFSFAVAPLLYLAPEGLWQVIRIFTGFYNVPIVTIVLVGLFTQYVPALGAKIVIIFHVVAYGFFQFILNDIITLHFLHLYAILFTVEVSILLALSYLRPRPQPWTFEKRDLVDMKPWSLARPAAVTLLSLVAVSYLVFSPVGIAGGGPNYLFVCVITIIALINLFIWLHASLLMRMR